MRAILTILLISLTCALSQAATTLSQKEILARCYAQLTGLRLKATDAHYGELATKTAAQVCASIVQNVKFDSSGRLVSETTETRAVLKQFNDLHRGWFDQAVWAQNQFGDDLYGTADVYDLAAPSMHITRALFAEQSYATALTGSDYLYAIRDQGSNKTLRPTRAYGIGGGDGNTPAFTDFDQQIVYSTKSTSRNFTDLSNPVLESEKTPTDLVQIGNLQGIGVKNDTANINFVYVDPNAGPNPNGITSPQNLHAHFGGGAIGEQALLLSTFGHGFDYHTNGTTKLPRRYIASSFKTFLCRPDTYVRDEDVTGYLRTNSDAPAFRNAVSCLKCHATMDQSAMLTRNLTPAGSGFLTNTSVRLTATMGRYPANQGAAAGQEEWPSSPTATFAYQQPAGRFYFRSYTGELKNVPLTVSDASHPLEPLGQAMAATDDYYACIASRYVNYFMGVSVPLVDPGNSANLASVASMTAQDKVWKKFVVDLGQKLKADGSLKNLITNIFNSTQYSQSNFGK